MFDFIIHNLCNLDHFNQFDFVFRLFFVQFDFQLVFILISYETINIQWRLHYLNALLCRFVVLRCFIISFRIVIFIVFLIFVFANIHFVDFFNFLSVLKIKILSLFCFVYRVFFLFVQFFLRSLLTMNFELFESEIENDIFVICVNVLVNNNAFE